jgi:hypothetical protein
MIKAGIDQSALITMFAEASAKQGEALRKAVSEATLRALQGRELTLDNIKKVVKNVAEAASTGIARNPAPAIDVEGLLGKALGGIDSALLQAVEANRKALEQFVSGGVSLSEKPLKEALANIEKMEDVFFAAVTKASQSAGPLEGPWRAADGPGADDAARRARVGNARCAGDARQLLGLGERRPDRHVGRPAGRRKAKRRLGRWFCQQLDVGAGRGNGSEEERGARSPALTAQAAAKARFHRRDSAVSSPGAPPRSQQ